MKNEKYAEQYQTIFDDSMYFLNAITSEYELYPAILKSLQDGSMSFSLKSRDTLRSIDELWVETIEQSLPSLDTVIRKPGRYIEENDMVLPIELSRNINSRSIQHLAQHTDYISKIEGDNITPSKILNVFNEETVMTYENKFINTLIDRLFIFVSRRYDAIIDKKAPDDFSAMEFEGQFKHSGMNGRLRVELELHKPKLEQKSSGEESLVARIDKLYRIVRSYTDSEFAKSMGKSYIKPPVMRTNAIMKNKDLRQCLALWQFIEGFEGAGYTVEVSENAQKPDDEFVSAMYSSVALQYLIFRYKTENDFDVQDELAFAKTETSFRPRFVRELAPIDTASYDVHESAGVNYSKPTTQNRLTMADIREITGIIDVALTAERIIDERRKQQLEEERRRAELLAEQERKAALERERQEKRNKTKSISLKTKKNIRRMAKEKARDEGVKLPKVFDYDELMRFLNSEKQDI